MNLTDLAHRRLCTQRLIGDRFEHPLEMVRWHLAVQAQDYPAAKWGIAQRCDGVADADLDVLFDEGKVLRTHVLRPTWHLVLPEDIHWLLTLTAPRVHKAIAGRHRQLELDTATLARSCDLIARALEGHNHLTRSELAERLDAAGIATKNQRLPHILMYAELEQIICSGPLRDRQFTYALLEERAPTPRTMDREEAIAEITRRYMTSHGPATPHDLAWWSGLTVTDARRGIAMQEDRLEQVTIEGTTWWFAPADPPAPMPRPLVHLLPGFDEYYVGFRNNEVAWDPEIRARYDTGREFWMNHYVALDGSIVGGWTRKLRAKQVEVSTNIPTGLDTAARASLEGAATEYGRFLGLEPVLMDDTLAV